MSDLQRFLNYGFEYLGKFADHMVEYTAYIRGTEVRGLSHPAFNIKIQVLHYIALTCSCSALKLKLLGFFVNVHDIKVDMFSSESKARRTREQLAELTAARRLAQQVALVCG